MQKDKLIQAMIKCFYISHPAWNYDTQIDMGAVIDDFSKYFQDLHLMTPSEADDANSAMKTEFFQLYSDFDDRKITIGDVIKKFADAIVRV